MIDIEKLREVEARVRAKTCRCTECHDLNWLLNTLLEEARASIAHAETEAEWKARKAAS